MRTKRKGFAKTPYVPANKLSSGPPLIRDMHFYKGRVSGDAWKQLTFWESRDADCFVYFVREEDGPVKIGVAKNPVSRQATLQTGNPRTLTLEHVLVGGVELEAQLHQRFRDQTVLREWFDEGMADAIVAFAGGLAAAQMDYYNVCKGKHCCDLWRLQRNAGMLA